MQIPRPPQDPVQGLIDAGAQLVEDLKRGALDEGRVQAGWRGRSLGVHDEDVQYLRRVK